MSASGPQISVIVPAYNAQQWLPACLDSVMAQTFSDFEVIIVDDGSTDATAAIAAGYAARDGRFRPVSRSNGGLSAARNTGIDAACAPWLFFLDADDLLYRSALSRLIETARETFAPIVVGRLMRSSDPSVVDSDPDEAVSPVFFTPDEALQSILYQEELSGSACGVLFSAELFRTERFREGCYYEDQDISCRLYPLVEQLALTGAFAARIACVPAPVYFYRDNPHSFIHTFSARRLDVLDVTDRILESVRADHPKAESAAISRRFSAYCNIFLLLLMHPLQGRRIAPGAFSRCIRGMRQMRKAILSDKRVRRKNRLAARLLFFLR